MAVNFQQFLINNGIHDFEERLFQWNTTIKEEEPENWIVDAFFWDDEPEGEEFWNKLDNEWSKICREQEVCYGGEFPAVPKG